MKYVVLKHPARLPVIICGLMTTHEDMIAGYRASGYTPTSAGFIRRIGSELETCGFSPSLNLTPDRGDAQLIAAMHTATLKTAPEERENARFKPSSPSYQSSAASGSQLSTLNAQPA